MAVNWLLIAEKEVHVELPRYRPKGVFGKGVGNSKNASEMRQKYIGKRGTFQNASEMRQKCAEHLWGRTLLDHTNSLGWAA